MEPNILMAYGGVNDVYQAVMQCFSSLTVFVGYFMREKHISANLKDGD